MANLRTYVGKSGNKYYFKNGMLHRLDGPAVEHINGHKEWWNNDKLHRLDGPAIEYINGDKSWYINDKQIDCSTQWQFERLMKLESFW